MIKRGFLLGLIIVILLNAGCLQSGTEYTTQETSVFEPTTSSQTIANDPAADPVDAYLLVIDDLYNQDTGLNGHAEYLAINCSAMVNLTTEGRARLLSKLEKYNLKILDKSMDQLKAEGYIQSLNFENGIFFEIKDQPMTESAILMSAMKWRSGTGAIGWNNRTVSWQNNSWELDESKESWIS